MPYIDNNRRKELNPLVTILSSALKNGDPAGLDGDLNYVITRLLKDLYPPKYFNYNRALGVLTAAQLEYYRVIVGPYEEEKRKSNGDVL